MITLICAIWLFILAIVAIQKMLGLRKGNTENSDHNSGEHLDQK